MAAHFGTFNETLDITLLSGLIGQTIRFQQSTEENEYDYSFSVDICGVLQAVLLETNGQRKELKFVFYNREFAVPFQEKYTIVAL